MCLALHSVQRQIFSAFYLVQFVCVLSVSAQLLINVQNQVRYNRFLLYYWPGRVVFMTDILCCIFGLRCEAERWRKRKRKTERENVNMENSRLLGDRFYIYTFCVLMRAAHLVLSTVETERGHVDVARSACGRARVGMRGWKRGCSIGIRVKRFAPPQEHFTRNKTERKTHNTRWNERGAHSFILDQDTHACL